MHYGSNMPVPSFILYIVVDRMIVGRMEFPDQARRVNEYTASREKSGPRRSPLLPRAVPKLAGRRRSAQSGQKAWRNMLSFSAREGAVPDCLVNTHHYCPGDSPLKMALRSILRSCVWCPDRWSR